MSERENRCPFCDEEIRPKAVKCRFCQTMLDGSGSSAPGTTPGGAPSVDWRTLAGPLGVGTLVREFRVARLIGQGGMGEVYLARNELSGQEFALKVVSPELMKDAGVRARFLEEARVMSRFNHPNIVKLQHFFEEGGRFFMVLEYIPGRSLDDFLDESPLTVEESVGLAKQVLDGLAYVHLLDDPVVHRDIKPSNILVTPEGRAVIIDFGVAKAVGRQKMTRTGAAVGTYEYMSPEQVQGKDVSPASDVYSMGIVLYKMLSGVVPFPQASEGGFEVMQSHVQKPPPPLEEFREGVPAWLCDVIARALAKRPDYRPANGREMIAALAAGGSERASGPIAAVRTAPPTAVAPTCPPQGGDSSEYGFSHPQKASPIWPWVVAAAAVVVVVLLALTLSGRKGKKVQRGASKVEAPAKAKAEEPDDERTVKISGIEAADEAPAEEKAWEPDEKKAEEAPAEEKAWEPDEKKAEEAPAEEKAWEPAEKKAEEAPAEEKVWEPDEKKAEEAPAKESACDRYMRCCNDYANAIERIRGMPEAAVAATRRGCAQVQQFKEMGAAAEQACQQALDAMREASAAYAAMPGFEMPSSCDEESKSLEREE
jgi:serine/threonine protein kinase